MALWQGTVQAREWARLVLAVVAALLAFGAAGAQAKDAGTSFPVTPVGLSDVVDLDAWFDQTCAVTGDGSVRCWGDVGGIYDAGASTFTATVRPAPYVVPGVSGAKRVSGRCVVKTDGTVWCWGTSWLSATPDPADAPTQVAGIDSVTDIDQGSQNVTCVVRTDATVWCWGTSRFGATGNWPTAPGAYTQPDPLAVPGLTGATAVAVGQQHACAVRQNGELWCWGSGAASRGVHAEPGPLDGYSGVIAVGAATEENCAVTSSGGVRCRGDNSYGEMGVRPDGYATGANPIAGLPAMTSVSNGLSHTCAVTTTGSGWCWGLQTDGRLGNPAYGGDGTSESPIPVLGLTNIKSFETGDAHTCALLTDATVRCFGSDARGQLGNGDDPLPADWSIDTPGAIQQADSTAPVRPTPTPAPTPAPQSTPTAKPVRQLVRSGKTVSFAAYKLAVRSGRSCPARVTVTIRPRKKLAPVVRTRLLTTRTNGACTVTATFTLPGRLAKLPALAVVVSGTGITTRTSALSPS